MAHCFPDPPPDELGWPSEESDSSSEPNTKNFPCVPLPELRAASAGSGKWVAPGVVLNDPSLFERIPVNFYDEDSGEMDGTDTDYNNEMTEDGEEYVDSEAFVESSLKTSSPSPEEKAFEPSPVFDIEGFTNG